MNNEKLDLWFDQITKLYETRLPDAEVRVSNDPEDFFDGFFTEVGLPVGDHFEYTCYTPSVLIYLDEASTRSYDPKSNSWKNEDETDYRVFRLDLDETLGEVNKSTGEITDLCKVQSPLEAYEYINLHLLEKLEDKPTITQLTAEEILDSIYIPFPQYPDDLSTESL